VQELDFSARFFREFDMANGYFARHPRYGAANA
jgi:hypothetical protein